MILGTKNLLKLVKKGKIVERLSKRELENPEGAGFDLRIGELHETKGRGFLGVDERKTPKMRLLAKFENDKKPKKVLLKPNVYYVMKTVEKVNMPENLLALFVPRSTLYRSGVYIFSGEVAPGYCGEITVGIYNFHKVPFELEMGARILHVMFFEVKGEANPYRGQWQGGRITTKRKEKQV